MRISTMAALVAVAMSPTLVLAQAPVGQTGADVATGVVRAGSRAAAPGPAANFTGRVAVTPVTAPEPPGRTTVGSVMFQPGARSNWHTHPAGQTLLVTEGCGWTQRAGGPVVRVCKGDAVYTPPGVRHWHGATATMAMTHTAITEAVDGSNVDWMEPVTPAEYRAAPAGR